MNRKNKKLQLIPLYRKIVFEFLLAVQLIISFVQKGHLPIIVSWNIQAEKVADRQLKVGKRSFVRSFSIKNKEAFYISVHYNSSMLHLL